jgi:hypothetical protein
MKIRAITGFAGADFSFFGGEEKEVPSELALTLIRDGLAEAVKETKVETAAIKPKRKSK